jgi:hypothetical protein
MISAPNHLQPLSGNKTQWVFILFLGLVSCKSTQNVVSSQTLEDKKTDWTDASFTFKVDTLDWISKSRKSIEVTPYPSSDQIASIKSKLNNSLLQEAYSISLLLPFVSSRVTEEDINFNNRLTSISYHFYNGFLQGVKENNQIILNVFDTEANPEILESRLNSDPKILTSNLIVGPYRTTSIEKVNQFANTFKIPFVSAFSAGAELEGENDFYIKLNPGLESHFKIQLDHALKTFNTEEIVFLGFEGTSEKYAVELLADIFNKTYNQELKPLIISEANALKSESQIPKARSKNKRLAVFIPSWSNQTYISTFLRNLSLAQSDSSQIRVYGMPQWLDFEFVDYEYFEKLNVHISSPIFIDHQDQNVKSFKSKYFNQYGVLPEKEAFLGHDIAEFFARLLKNYGTKFQYSLPYLDYQGLNTRFKIKPILELDSAGRSYIKRWENQYIHILEFKNYQFNIDHSFNERRKVE